MNKSITVAAKLEQLDAVLDFVSGELEAHDYSPRAVIQTQIAVEELFVNIAHYAYAPGEGEATISCGYDEVEGAAVIEFCDRGIPYDPLARDDPDVTLAAEEREVGGLGILMVKKSVDSVAYRYEDGCNRLRITKKR